MTYELFHQLIIQELERVFAEKPFGTMAKVQREMGVNKHYFHQWKAGTNIPMPRLLEALSLLEEDATDFICRALQRKKDAWVEMEEAEEVEYTIEGRRALEAMKIAGVLHD